MTIVFHWPQWVMLALISTGVVLHISKHGEQIGEYNGVARFANACIMIWLLWCGGFWG